VNSERRGSGNTECDSGVSGVQGDDLAFNTVQRKGSV